MTATHADYAITALCLWREDRSGQFSGMTAVGCVIRNRVLRDHSTFYAECTRRWQFSSLTAPGDAELTLFPTETDPQWQMAQLIAQNIIEGDVADVTDGATLYYAPAGMPAGKLPSWLPKSTFTVEIGGQKFYK